MGKLTSTIGIPIKLLNEAQVYEIPLVLAYLIADIAGVCRVMSLHLRSHPAKFIVGNYLKVHPSPAV